jgi:hypothetical protein
VDSTESEGDDGFANTIVRLLQLVVSTPEYQLG